MACLSCPSLFRALREGEVNFIVVLMPPLATEILVCRPCLALRSIKRRHPTLFLGRSHWEVYTLLFMSTLLRRSTPCSPLFTYRTASSTTPRALLPASTTYPDRPAVLLDLARLPVTTPPLCLPLLPKLVCVQHYPDCPAVLLEFDDRFAALGDFYHYDYNEVGRVIISYLVFTPIFLHMYLHVGCYGSLGDFYHYDYNKRGGRGGGHAYNEVGGRGKGGGGGYRVFGQICYNDCRW